MIEIRKTAIALDENDLIRLDQIIIDSDETEALKFLRKVVYDRVVHQQQGRLKSHLDTAGDPVSSFKEQREERA